MANLKEVRDRISSVNSTKQITSAMKLVAAAKLRRAQDAIVQMRPYALKLKEILANLSDVLDEDNPNPYYEKREVKRVLLVTFSGDKGLCGSFNSNVIKATKANIKKNYAQQQAKGNVDIYSIGKKAGENLKRNEYNVLAIRDDIFGDLTYEKLEEIAADIMQQFVEGKYDKVELIFNSFRNAATYNTTVERFLPVEQDFGQDEEQEEGIKQDYIFEPSKTEILNELIPRSLKVNFFRAALDSNAAEHGSRMTAMDQATDNAQELLDDLKLKYNKERQAAITNEILEIVSGANALENG